MKFLDKASSVFILSDAAVDEYMATLFVHSLTGENARTIAGEIIVNADCIAGPAMQTGWKIREYLGVTRDMPLGLSGARGWNPFPWEYRSDCVSLGQVPCLNNEKDQLNWPPYPDGDQMLINFLEQSAEGEATILCLCPITPLTDVLKNRPDLMCKIAGLVWMAGAIHVPGNLDKATLPESVWNDKAEWNVFWDPFAADWLFKNTSFPILLAPLDVSDPIKITPEFLQQLNLQAQQGSALSTLAYQAYSLVEQESFYRLWDVTAASVFQDLSQFQTEVLNLSVETQGQNEGALVIDPSGRDVLSLMKVADLNDFYQMVCRQFNG